jgi:hypothetical protein
MNHEVEKYVGELAELREKTKIYEEVLKRVKLSYQDQMIINRLIKRHLQNNENSNTIL